MKEQLITLLETFGYPVFLQGSIASPEEYPESFFTFWVTSAPEGAFYDNEPNRCVWGFWVYFYSTDPMLVLEKSEAARQLLQHNGFFTNGKPTDLPVDAPAYTGSMFSAYIAEEYTNAESNEEQQGSPGGGTAASALP